jgi:hypothetical protein
VEHRKIRITKSFAEEGDEIGDGFRLAFIKGIDNKHRRQTLAQPGLQVSERLAKQRLHLVTKRLAGV